VSFLSLWAEAGACFKVLCASLLSRAAPRGGAWGGGGRVGVRGAGGRLRRSGCACARREVREVQEGASKAPQQAQQRARVRVSYSTALPSSSRAPKAAARRPHFHTRSFSSQRRRALPGVGSPRAALVLPSFSARAPSSVCKSHRARTRRRGLRRLPLTPSHRRIGPAALASAPPRRSQLRTTRAAGRRRLRNARVRAGAREGPGPSGRRASEAARQRAALQGAR